jgi:hypothetical protein
MYALSCHGKINGAHLDAQNVGGGEFAVDGITVSFKEWRASTPLSKLPNRTGVLCVWCIIGIFYYLNCDNKNYRIDIFEITQYVIPADKRGEGLIPCDPQRCCGLAPSYIYINDVGQRLIG